MRALADQAARDRIAADLETTLVVEAAAGTGKTTALVDRIVAAVVQGRAELARVVALTFTEAAAGELKLRLRERIEEARKAAGASSAARARLERALEELEEARIGTIHAFCADLLREHPVAAGVDPRFEIVPEDAAGLLLDRAFGRWFEEQLAAPGEGVRRVLRRRPGYGEGPRATLRRAAADLVDRRDFPTPWRHEPFDRGPAMAVLLAELAALGAAAATLDPEDWFTKSLVQMARFVEDVTRRDEVLGPDEDWLEAALVRCRRERHWRWIGWNRTEAKVALMARRDALAASLDAFADAAGRDLAPRLRDELWSVVERYDRIKGRAGCLDFLDLLLSARDLVRNDDAVRRLLQERFTHLFVDEFQDTDPLQAELLLLLAAADPAERDWRRVRPVPGKLFLVADPKQSIYRFRRADVALYEGVKRQLVAAGADVLDLQVSFRAVPELQEAVNAAFAPCMDGSSPSQARYVPLAPHRPRLPGQPALIALPVPAPYGDFGTKVVNLRIEESLPDAVAGFVQWLCSDSRWTVTERDRPTTRVPVEPRHVCILFRRFQTFGQDVTRPYVRALEARRVPHLLVGGGSFHVREEIEALRNALAAIERPEDELMIFATLRGPLFALGDDALLAFRTQVGSLHPFRPMPDGMDAGLAEVADALAVLRDLHRQRNRRPIADTISALLGAVRAHAAFAVWPTGEQALANVGRLLDLARRAERRGVTSFRAFVERLDDDAERGDASEAPIVEEGMEGVRLMTVHRAKGLEFPVVILADPTCNETGRDVSRWVDADRGLCAQRLAGVAPAELAEHAGEELEREREEAARLLYVATTRARDLLVVTAVGEGRHDGWLSRLQPILYPPDGARPDAAAGCPPFGGETLVERPSRVRRPASAVAPGEHRPAAGAHRVVWWDPGTLVLDPRESVGLRQRRLLEADEGERRASAGVEAHAAWREGRAADRARGAVPSRQVIAATVRAAAPGADGVADEVEVIELAIARPRPHGTRFGTLVHALLSRIDLDATGAEVAAAAAVEGRLLGAPADEVAEAAEVTTRALAHPLLRRAAAAGHGGCRREAPVALTLDDGSLVEGVLDVAFLDDDGWTVVDLKTDVALAGRLAEYRRQVALYARAVARATGRPARGVLFRV